ncbi:ABC transporter permease [Saccharothrix sp. 6-C]|uniref:Transport permease protein n=1 Tax=Saccharothrix texasensis TaxID=103734 RepID=A0A3N1H6E9_9PSEU|nr:MULTISPECIES: ABC transporter permease [Saccharothrix]QQQ77763.1 ABC transporter permease [Saccharothrix sp. 6-C]ROP37782.1 ABC-2 type transport system permease protein [Saccharothrix texasensis]
MNTKAQAIRLGVDRGVREFRHSLGSSDQGYNLFTGLAALTVLWFQRDSPVDGAGLSLAALTLPGLLGMGIVFGALVGPAGQLSVNREDGTLLRAKAVPHGMVGYLVGRTVQTSLDSLVGLLIVLVPGLFLVNVLADAGVGGILGLLAVLAFGMVSMMPWGAVAGSITKSPGSAMGITMLPMMGVVAISGIFYPITAMPGWLQGVAQVFPVYWAGHGARAALLPDSAAAAEIGGSWRILEMAGVLGVWTVVGFLLAPTILRRMARRESGSDMEQRRQAALQRVR